MDKFTVDLDQVLNDFEYSELTDQYNAVRPQIDTSSSVNHNNVTKHSINNVFHSLNEYLNTSVDVPNTEINIEKDDLLKKVENNSVRNLGSPFDDTDYSKPVEDCADNKFLEENKEYKFNENTTFANKTQHVEESNEPLNNTQITEHENLDIHQKNIDPVENLNPILCIDENSIKTLVNNDETDFKENIGNGGNVCISNDEKASVLIHLDTNLISNDSNKIENDFILNETLDEPISVTVNNQIIEDLVTKISDEIYVDKVEVNPIGFQEITDVDDEEIHELLAELENEQDLIESENYGTNTKLEEDDMDTEDFTQVVEDVTQESEDPILVTKEPTITKESLEPNATMKDETNDTETEENITELVEKLSTDDIKIIDKPNIETTEHSISEDFKSSEPVVEKVKTEKHEFLQEAVLEKVLVKGKNKENVKNKKISKVENIKKEEEVVKEESSKVEESNKKTEEDKGDNVNISNPETVARPQNLSLKESESQREINLIGGPGSTPYNNVYITEEIGKHQEQDNESISSTSSNTFSDTASTVSTASTEEIRDENDLTITNPSHVEEQTVRPTENLERGSRELSDDGDNARNSVEEVSERNETSEGQATRISGDGENTSSGTTERQWLGKEAPLWIPDSDTTSCLHCDMKFTVLKRRHHCRACGLVLCSKCCHLRFKLEYLDAEARVCNKCHDILNKDTNSSSSSDLSSPDPGNSPLRRPNPNNPLEYCSTISPLQQVSGTSPTPLPAVMVPVGVLKRKGSNKSKSNKSVMFCDGIRPGSDLTNLDNDFNYNNTKTKKLEKTSTTASAGKINRNLPLIDSETNSFIPKNENNLPPLVTITKTDGLINVGQDEIVIILEYIDEESFVPKDVFYHINNIYVDAVKGTSIKELGLSLHNSSNFLDSKNHAGFVYIRPTFQCLENVIKPKEPFLVGILIHRWETPWAKLFPLRLILRLGAEYRYYPSPVISTRHRDSVFVEIGHTIINLLADFRNFSYTLPQINGLTIHMEDKNTTVTIPINRYDQIIKSLNNSSDHILAFGGAFSQEADSHLVCIQDTQGNENCYSTHAINIQNKPRKVTGASFIVFNGALKSSSGLTAKSNIVEDGLMIQVLPEHMQQIRENLRAMKNHTIPCGCVNAASDETVNIVWGENDTNFNIGITSSIDGMSLSGIPSIRVHNGKNHYGANGNRIIRWTEVFIIQSGDENPKNQDPIDVSRISESIAKATCDALLNYLDLLVTNNFQKIGIRTTLHVDSVSYCAGSNNTRLPPIYMKSLDNELIPVLHRITSGNLGENSIILELIFRILNV